MLYNNSIDVKYALNGEAEYQVNEDLETVYIAIMGDTEALYDLQLNVEG